MVRTARFTESPRQSAWKGANLGTDSLAVTWELHDTALLEAWMEVHGVSSVQIDVVGSFDAFSEALENELRRVWPQAQLNVYWVADEPDNKCSFNIFVLKGIEPANRPALREQLEQVYRRVLAKGDFFIYEESEPAEAESEQGHGLPVSRE